MNRNIANSGTTDVAAFVHNNVAQVHSCNQVICSTFGHDSSCRLSRGGGRQWVFVLVACMWSSTLVETSCRAHFQTY